MPGWPVHEYLDWIFFGRVYSKIHRAIDEPVKYFGRSHRIFFHDYTSAYAIATELYPDDTDAILAAYNHIYYDETCSSMPEYKRNLEKMELLTRKERKRDQAERKRIEKEMKKDPVLGPFLQYIKKMEEAMKLTRLILDS